MNNIDLTELLFENLIKQYNRFVKDKKRPPFFLIACSLPLADLKAFINEVVLYPSDEPRLQRLISLSEAILNDWNNKIFPLESEMTEQNQPVFISIDSGKAFIITNSINKWIEQTNPEPFTWDNLMYFTNEVNGYLKQKTKVFIIDKTDQEHVGFDCPLSKDEVKEVYKIMTDKHYIQGDLEDFYRVFNKAHGQPQKPVIWNISPGKPNKTALFTFIKLMVCPDGERFKRTYFHNANELFSPKKIFENISYPTEQDQKTSRAKYFTQIKALIENTRPH